MRVKMKVGISGGRADGTEWPPAGETLDVEAREGAELCAAGLAEAVVEERKAETRPAPDDEEKRSEEEGGTPARAAAAKSPAAERPAQRTGPQGKR